MWKLNKMSCPLLASMTNLKRLKRRKETECQLKRVEIGKSNILNKFKKWTEIWKERLKNSAISRKEKSSLLQENLSKYYCVLVSLVSSIPLLKCQTALIQLKNKGLQLKLSQHVKECGHQKCNPNLTLRTTRNCCLPVNKWCLKKPYWRWTMEKRSYKLAA